MNISQKILKKEIDLNATMREHKALKVHETTTHALKI